MQDIGWSQLRSLEGSKHNAFEELCCQLAAQEPFPKGSRFRRVGAPDAGVECYWTLPDQTEVAWQAKYFLSTPGSSQWAQLDESVKTAIAKHPALSRYVVCLPLDRADARIEGKQYFMDKWDERVEKWKGWAEDAGLDVDFEYWGQSELLTRLAKEENAGRYRYWFDTGFFSEQWFADLLEERIADADHATPPNCTSTFRLPGCSMASVGAIVSSTS